MKRQRKYSAILCFLAFAATPLCLGESVGFVEGKQAYDQHNYSLAWSLWRQAAEEQTGQDRDPRVYFHLGVLYDQGLGVDEDDAVAFSWYEKAALLGHSIASFNLGNAYKFGRGVEKNEERASHWWQKAADAGLANAQFNMAIQYYSGLGVARDNEKAVIYFNFAAQNGHEKASQLIASNKVPRLEPEQLPRQGQNLMPSADKDVSLGDTSAPAGDSSEPPQTSANKSAQREEGVSWLHQQNPQHFSIQLAMTENDEGIAAFIARHNLSGQVETAVIVRQGKPFYYVLMGSFADRGAATEKILAMPAPLRQLKPWPRRFADLHGLADRAQ